MTPRSCETRIIAIPDCSLQLDEQGEDLLLHRDVDRRRRLVGEQQLRSGRDGHRDHDPLAHAAAQLVRVVPRPLAGEGMPTELQAAPTRLFGSLLLADSPSRIVQHLCDLVADRVDGVQARAGILEDHRDLATANASMPAPPGPTMLRPSPENLAVEDLARLRHHADDRPQGHALSATGLADDAERLRRREGEVDMVGGEQDAAQGREPDRQPAHLEQASAHAGDAHRLGSRDPQRAGGASCSDSESEHIRTDRRARRRSS